MNVTEFCESDFSEVLKGSSWNPEKEERNNTTPLEFEENCF